MATRRIATDEKTHLDQDETRAEPVSNISPAVPTYVSIKLNNLSLYTNKHRSVIAKLLAFTAAMIVLPIGSYFVSVNTLFRGSFIHASTSLTSKRLICDRQRNVRRRISSSNGQCSPDRLRHRSFPR